MRGKNEKEKKGIVAYWCLGKRNKIQESLKRALGRKLK